jgi:hypothetical protein
MNKGALLDPSIIGLFKKISDEKRGTLQNAKGLVQKDL